MFYKIGPLHNSKSHGFASANIQAHCIVTALQSLESHPGYETVM